MKNVTPAQAATNSQALTAYRTTLLGLIINNPLFTDAEQVRANHSAHECECPIRMARWMRNVKREADRRRANPPARYATGTQRETIVRLLNHPKVSRSQKTGVLLTINRLTETEAAVIIGKLYAQTGVTPPSAKPVEVAAPAADVAAPAKRTVRPTSKADLRAAAKFVPGCGLTPADFATGSAVATAAAPHLTAYAATACGTLRPALAGEFVCLTLSNN